MSRRAAAPLLACAALALLVAAPVRAASITSCTVSAVGVAFGTYTPLQTTALDMNGTINIACTGVTGRNTVTIDLSTGASNSYATRSLVSGTNSLSYNLYFDAAYTQVWGNGTSNSVEGTATIRKAVPNATLSIYGAIFAKQDPAAGTYGDTITISVNY